MPRVDGCSSVVTVSAAGCWSVALAAGNWLWMSSCRCRRFLLQLVPIPFCRYRVVCSWSLVQSCLCFHCWLWLLFCCFCCLCWLRLMLCCNCRCIFWLQWLLEGTCRRFLVGPRGRISVGSLEHRLLVMFPARGSQGEQCWRLPLCRGSGGDGEGRWWKRRARARERERQRERERERQTDRQ